MKTTTMLAVLLCAGLALALAGCSSDGERNVSRQPTYSPPATPPAADRAKPPAQPERRAAADRPFPDPAQRAAIPAAALGGADMSMVTVSLPGGKGGMVLLEKAAPKEVRVGKEFEYRIRLTNATDATLQGTVLTGKLPADFKVTSTTPQAAISGLDATWDVGKLSPMEAKVFAVRGAATKTGTLYGCSDVTFRVSSACVAIKVVEPALQLVEAAPAAVLICEAIPIRFVVTNSGSGNASNVMIKATLPDGLKSASGMTEVLYNVGPLAAGQSREGTLEVRAEKTGEFVTKAVATADDGLLAEASAKTVVSQPALVVAKEGPKTRFINTPVTYTITVTNKGNGAAMNTTLVDTLPANAVLVGATERGQVAGGNITWALGTLLPNQTSTATVVVKPGGIGQLQSLASASCSCSKASAKAVTDIRGVPGLLLEMVDITDPIAIGDTETYVVTITNQGTADGTNIVVVCDIPEEQAFVSCEGDTRGTAAGRKVTFDPVRTLAPKAKVVFKVVTKALAEADSRFKTSFTSDQTVEPVYKTESTHIFSDK